MMAITKKTMKDLKPTLKNGLTKKQESKLLKALDALETAQQIFQSLSEEFTTTRKWSWQGTCGYFLTGISELISSSEAGLKPLIRDNKVTPQRDPIRKQKPVKGMSEEVKSPKSANDYLTVPRATAIWDPFPKRVAGGTDDAKQKWIEKKLPKDYEQRFDLTVEEAKQLPGILKRFVPANLEYNGFYSCMLDGVKTVYVLKVS